MPERTARGGVGRAGCRMTIEVVLLALASTVRPTSLAAVYALIANESPRRLMAVYIIAGLAFTIAFGLPVIWAFNGIDVNSGTHETKGIAEIGGGLVALLFAALSARGASAGRTPTTRPKPHGRWQTLLEHDDPDAPPRSPGPATHIPGLFYLIALNVIVAHQPERAGRAGGGADLQRGLVHAADRRASICIVDPAAAARRRRPADVDASPHPSAAARRVPVAGVGLVIRGLLDI